MKLVPFESLGAVSYSPSVVTMALSCIVCELKRLICRKSRNYYNPPVLSAPAEVTSLELRQKCLLLVKLELSSEKIITIKINYVKPFPYNTAMQWTDRQTDR